MFQERPAAGGKFSGFEPQNHKKIEENHENTTQNPQFFPAPSEPDVVLIRGGWKLNWGVS